jgi:hypothetical protein
VVTNLSYMRLYLSYANLTAQSLTLTLLRGEPPLINKLAQGQQILRYDNVIFHGDSYQPTLPI